MNAKQMLRAFAKAGKRCHLVGDHAAGVIVGLDMEARWFAVLGGEVVNRVNPEAIAGQSTCDKYLNPGGDGLWSAPEGTSLGYQYSTGVWRVPPGLISARFRAADVAKQSLSVAAEVDLVNASGLGVPTLFGRRIAVQPNRNGMTVRAVESIAYIGRAALRSKDCLLAPWSLCQFDSGPDCEVVFPCSQKASVWDLYDPPSDAQREWGKRLCRTRTDGSQRYQIALATSVPWIEFRDPRRGLTVRRKAGPLPAGQSYIDIRDASPDAQPSRKGVRYSVYSDTFGFMEIEAAGGCPAVLRPNTEMKFAVSTRFMQSK
jgi:hypothetical protein